MPKPTRHNIRKAEVARVADFDEQLWPINVSLFVLAGFVAGIVLATSDFHDPRILHNGWVHLGLVAIMVGVLSWAVLWLQGKILRRVQLCVLISLLAHLWLGTFLHNRYLAMVAIEEAHQNAELDESEPVTIPDYHWEGMQPIPTRQNFEKPVSTETPEVSETEPIEPPRPEDELPVTVPRPTEPEPSPDRPDPIEIRRVDLSSPRRAELAAGGQISRQPWKHRPEPAEPIPRPTVQPAGRDAPSTLRSQVAAVRRTSEQPVHQRRTFEPDPSAQRRQDSMQLARRATGTKPMLDAPTTPTPTRHFDRPADMPRHELATPSPTRSVQSSQTAVPRQTTATRQRPIPTPSRQPSTTTLTLPRVAASPTLPAAVLQQSEPIASKPLPDAPSPTRPTTLARAQRRADLPSTVLVQDDMPTPAAAGSPPESRLDVSQTASVQRAAAEAPRRQTTAATGTAEFAVGSVALAARVGQPRASKSGQPGLTPNGPAPRIARSRSGTPAPVTPHARVEENPSLVTATGHGGPVSPSADTQATAMGRTGGVGIPQLNPTATAGSGPEIEMAGTAGATGAIPLARVVGQQARFSVSQGGGTPRPARSFGRALAGDAQAELPDTVPAENPSAGQTAGPRLEAKVSGQQRQAAGLPGSLVGRPTSGAILAMTPNNMSHRAAAARRATASQPDPGALGSAPAIRTTLTRTPRGAELPAAAIAVEHATAQGAEGQAASPGSSASRLEVASSTTVRRASAEESGSLRRATLDVAGQTTENTPGSESHPVGLAGNPQTTSAAEAILGEGPSATTQGTTTGPRRLRMGDQPSPSLAAEIGGGPLKKSVSPGLLRGLADTAREESVAGDAGVEPGDFRLDAGPEMGELQRREGGLHVEIAALAGSGGLSLDPTPIVGIPSRRARPKSEVVSPTTQRFVLQRTGGKLALDGRVGKEPPDAFRQRTPKRRLQSARKFGGTERTERAVEAGLDFLARHRFADGHWSLDQLPSDDDPAYRDAAMGQMHSDTAATGLALLAFLGAGYTHIKDKHHVFEDKHYVVVREGLDWLIDNQQPTGELFTSQTDRTRYARSYAHGIAAIALCEAYGMTRDPKLRRPAEKAIEYIYAAQHPTLGGWRYTPEENGQAWIKESDTSVSGWQLMALKSAQMAGLPVEEDVLNRVSGWLDSAQFSGGARYAYNPNAANTAEQRHGLVPNQVMTAEGLLMRMYLGWQRDNPALVEGAELLKTNLPEVGTTTEPLRDGYYWYYATQVMFHMQGDYWNAWNDRLHPLLESSQVTSGPLAGSWHPTRPLPDRWASAGGRLYVTTMNLLMLEVYYRHLPLFKTLE